MYNRDVLDSLTIDEVVRQTGLTSRALRYYEARGLLRPLRTASGRRLFSASELERVHQIIALKMAGLSLARIGQVIDRKQISLEALIEGQLTALNEEARKLDAARGRFSSLLSRIQAGEQLDVASLCSLIKETECMSEETKWRAVIDRYYAPEEQVDWLANVKPELEAFMTTDYNAKWRELGKRIEAALPFDPDSETALRFVRDWFALLEPFSRIATPEMWNGARDFYDELPKWEHDVQPAFSSGVWQIIRQAADAALASGKDIGPMPEWMRRSPINIT